MTLEESNREETPCCSNPAGKKGPFLLCILTYATGEGLFVPADVAAERYWPGIAVQLRAPIEEDILEDPNLAEVSHMQPTIGEELARRP